MRKGGWSGADGGAEGNGEPVEGSSRRPLLPPAPPPPPLGARVAARLRQMSSLTPIRRTIDLPLPLPAKLLLSKPCTIHRQHASKNCLWNTVWWKMKKSSRGDIISEAKGRGTFLRDDLGDLGGRALRGIADRPRQLVRLGRVEVGRQDVGLGAALDLRASETEEVRCQARPEGGGGGRDARSQSSWRPRRRRGRRSRCPCGPPRGRRPAGGQAASGCCTGPEAGADNRRRRPRTRTSRPGESGRLQRITNERSASKDRVGSEAVGDAPGPGGRRRA
jgi:hypothetical protein